MNFIFLMDPLEKVVFEKDTSFIFMLESHKRGHNVYFVGNGGLALENQVYFHAQRVAPQKNKNTPFVYHEKIKFSEEKVDAVFVRTDPPFDNQYVFNTWILDRLSKRVAVINNPRGLREVNEKIWATQFKQFTPPTYIGRNREDLRGFASRHKKAVAKPIDGFGGKAIFIVEKNDPNANVILETLTDNFSKDILLQKYIPAAIVGDKRILLLNGEVLGAVLRVHSKTDHRNNFFAGGKPFPTKILPREYKIIEALKPHLRELGLYFVGIDILGDYLSEVNVTSPTCLQEMNRLYKTQLESKVIEFTEKLVEEKRKKYKI